MAAVGFYRVQQRAAQVAAVIARLEHDTVTTALLQAAGSGSTYGSVDVDAVAELTAGPQLAVTADGIPTGGQAGAGVAVALGAVTFAHAVGAHRAVCAGCAVVALLATRPQVAVAAGRGHTGVQAGIGVGVVTVITRLHPTRGHARTVFALAGVQILKVLTRYRVGAQVAVSAGRQFAGIKAEVAVDIIGVVALLNPGAHETVATAGITTGVQATVGVAGVAVVAVFERRVIDLTVAALVLATAVAPVQVIGVAVVALLARSFVGHAIAANRQRAVGVAFFLLAYAIFIDCARVSVAARQPVTTAGDTAIRVTGGNTLSHQYAGRSPPRRATTRERWNSTHSVLDARDRTAGIAMRKIAPAVYSQANTAVAFFKRVVVNNMIAAELVHALGVAAVE